MKKIHIINPVAGHNHSLESLQKDIPSGEPCHVTTGVGDAEAFVYNLCLEEPETHFVVYGGDGTLNEAANGIIKASAGEKALLSVIPTGTGNDFVRSFPEKGKICEIDALCYNGRYAVNIINFGFDSLVVEKTERYKHLFPGSAAYIVAVADALLHKIGDKWDLEYEDEAGTVHRLNGIFTLALAANCRFYGGGFYSAPLADCSDGLIDLISVKAVSRLQFLRLVSAYKKGLHLDAEKQAPIEKFKDVLLYSRCRRIRIRDIKNLCADGEIQPCDSVELSILPRALRIAT